ncbi:MarR family transcriptional regulator [Shinella yambaruensis]|uniref:Transcriptional regulator n=1 Tax=Shinella yambaruensis TaxID=415996 RepID=A0ABQ5ZG70_9HYPH|nr:MULTISPECIES: MarR family transcriptional regulator [Shinella]MCJ8029328.1 MarR family transcriptional regulator [Shinella yambaruensis]MCU7983823.1 MarR family transcriptional regulator [Shinella yambaruensis]MCW5709073.1 MarR family transcriptional regulator [Shinella sp.]GLR50615.1 transcriptional regulator [Shinella yambaruensis]
MAERSLNEHLSHLLAQANRHLSRQLTAEGVSLDQWRLMKVLSESGGLPMGKLAEELALNLPTLTKLVDRMVQDALVYRVPDPADRRKVRMFLSDKGAAMLASQNKRVEEHEAKVEDSYGNEDAQRLKTMLESFIKQIV